MNMTTGEKLEALRAHMRAHHMQAYIVPTDDYHASEYVGAHFKARAKVRAFRQDSSQNHSNSLLR